MRTHRVVRMKQKRCVIPYYYDIADIIKVKYKKPDVTQTESDGKNISWWNWI